MYKNSLLCKPNWFHIFLIIPIFITSVLFAGAFNSSYAEENVTYTQNIVHKHTGNSTAYGGCYRDVEVKTTIIEEPCKGHMVYYPEWNKTQCDFCGASYDGDDSYRDCWTTFPREEKTATYKINCGYSNNQQIGTYSVVQSSTEWSDEVVLSMSLTSSVLSEGRIKYTVNGSTIEGNTFPVTENGTYTVNIVQSANISSSPVSLTVSNIDKTPPSFTIDYNTEPELPSVDITITATDNSDGSGLDPAPYSFDGGVTWTDNPIGTVTENGPVTIVVKDLAGNEATEAIEITNIKKPVPPPDVEDSGKETPQGSASKPSDTNNSDNGQAISDYAGNEGTTSDDLGNEESLLPESPTSPPSPVATPAPQKKKSSVPQNEITSDAGKTPVTVKVTSPTLKTQGKSKSAKELKKDPVTVVSPERMSAAPAETPSEKNASPEIAEILLWIMGAICLAVLIVIVFLLLCRISVICNMKERDRYVFKGFKKITKRDGIFEIDIDRDLFEKCDTGKLLLKLPPLFCASHRNKEMIVYLPDKQSYGISVSRRVYLSVKI